MSLPSVSLSLEQLLERVRRAVPRLTKGKKAVLSALYGAKHPLTAHEIYMHIAKGIHHTTSETPNTKQNLPIDLVTIYRNLEQLERLHLVVKIEHSQTGWRYALTDRPHIHTITCTECGQEISVGECLMADIEQFIAQKTGFTNIHHVVHFTGSCPQCQHHSAST
ncbi:MAG: transcriptional repressor [Candidatus Kapabacteria bacterium]|nr:transcriptional repressor [Candidatus Kapabacteria bacterium]